MFYSTGPPKVKINGECKICVRGALKNILKNSMIYWRDDRGVLSISELYFFLNSQKFSTTLKWEWGERPYWTFLYEKITWASIQLTNQYSIHNWLFKYLVIQGEGWGSSKISPFIRWWGCFPLYFQLGSLLKYLFFTAPDCSSDNFQMGIVIFPLGR